MITKRFNLLWMAAFFAGCPAKEDAQPSGGGVLTPPPQAGETPASQPANPHGDQFKSDGPPGEPISGLVKLGEGMTDADVKPTDVLFVMVRESQGGGKFGRLIAVQRHGQVQFPKRYEIGSNDAMVPGMPFKGPFIVMARLDRDGDPMTRKPEDLYGVVTREVKAGEQEVHITLEKSSVQDPAGEPPPSQQPASQPAP